jgi:nicotinate-nucleotide--dimethylbenzimidazole phosphoribosyltransferase
MTRAEALCCLDTGIALAADCPGAGIDLVGTGDMGIANTTPSAAIIAAFSGLAPAQVTHRGTGIDDAALSRKVRAIETSLALNRPDPRDPVDVLAKVGGFEIGGIAGLIVGCAAAGIPVVVDGFISTAGALVAAELHPHVGDYLFAAHRSVEVGHTVMLARLRLEPMLDLSLRLGEGTGAALGMTLIEAALRLLREVKTFDETGVSEGTSP